MCHKYLQMASILLSSLKKPQLSTDIVNKNFTYTDVAMDMAQKEERDISKKPDMSRQIVYGKDIKTIHDFAAIENSIFYILATTPGQRPLLPTFGCDIRRYLAEPITDDTSQRIQEDVKRAIESWEPRVVLSSVDVIGDPETHTYFISINAYLPYIKGRSLSVFGKVTTEDGIFRRTDTNEYK